MHRWLLFVDESGNLDEARELAVVAGVLVRLDGDPAWFEQQVRAAIEWAYPGVAYPPHATVLNKTTGLVASTYRRHLRDPSAGAPRPALRAAWDALCAAAPELPAAARVVAATRKHQEPRDWADLEECDRYLKRHHGGAYEGALGLAQQGGAGMARALARLPTCAAADSNKPRPAAFVVAAAARDVDDAFDLGATGDRTVTDRYLSLLGAMLERTMLLLRAEPPAHHEVRLAVATRHVPRPGLPATPLTASDVGEVVGRVIGYPFLPAEGLGDARLRFHCDATPKYDARVHPGVVLADFVANRLRRILGQAIGSTPYSRVAENASRDISLPVEQAAAALQDAGPLPTLAADGQPRAAIRAHLEAEADAAPLPARPRWARDEASAWIGAL
ncbi:MAG: hypothetical protein KC543_08640 [Myxococcales bacterium]|nr:hypothetical protein [Myxococcales bacterium]